jgi:NADH:ubiquinone oxidoreductase subunit 3 (subunit A)
VLSLILFFISKIYSSNIKSFDSSIEAYECGFAPFDDATRQPFDIHYYIVGLLFLIFDVEITLIVP